VVLENKGKPMLLPFHCTDEDIQWAGLTCSEEEPCPVYLELDTAESVGKRIIAAGNIHSSAATLYSVLLGSEDGGQTWAEVHPRIRGAVLDHLQSFDREAAWISGQSPSPLPHDPFLLVTTDGGSTWRQKNLFAEDAESRFGSIQQVVFASKDSGSLVIDRGPGSGSDRYVLYESPNSGDTWQVKQESGKPIRLKSGPAAAPDWRVRADAPTKSFHLERRQVQRWSTVAAFAVKIAFCKPQPNDAPPGEVGKPPVLPPVIKK
jgi:photosystem II stability/assembly factor-like uncharacterized protein